jgi:hypothetical protein
MITSVAFVFVCGVVGAMTKKTTTAALGRVVSVFGLPPMLIALIGFVAGFFLAFKFLT